MSDLRFQKLTPTSNVDLNVYEEGFEFIFSNDDIRNIAVSGPYSSGKSSLLESYKKKHPQKTFIHISLAHFTNENKDNEEKEIEDEVISYYGIEQGNFDTVTGCKYSVPSFLDIGKLYSIMIEDCANSGEEVQELLKIFSSFISDEISNFNTDLYYQNPDYLEWSYREGKLLD